MDAEIAKSPPETEAATVEPTGPQAEVENVNKSASDATEGNTLPLKEAVGEGAKPDEEATTAPPDQPSTSIETPGAEDVEMKDATEDPPLEVPFQEAITSTDTPKANGAPATNKRASIGGSSKKKTASVPEHKTKKLNKKKSRPLTHLDAQPGEYYFARMKGHPWWPSIVCDEAMLPHSLLSTRPVTAALPDGSFKREDYAPGGKRAYERTFPIMFLHTNEFAWIPNTELNPLDPSSDEVQNFQEKGKTKQLIAAYATAKQASDLESFKTMLVEHEKAIQDDLALQEERAAKKVEKAKRAAARKDSEVKNDDDMDVDKPAGTEKAKTKKRKKTGDDIDEDEKPAKTPKTATKLKLSTPRQPTEAAPKKSLSKAKSKTAKSSSDDDAQPSKAEEKQLTPAEARDIKEKKVLYFRHKLQRGFLSRDANIKEEEMEQMSGFLKELQEHTDLEAEIIRNTKIHKVLKQMIKLDNIPRQAEFGFKDRATDLLAHWNDTLAKDTPPEEAVKSNDAGKEGSAPAPAEAAAEEPAPTTNGQTETNDEKAEEDTYIPDIGTTDATASIDAEVKLDNDQKTSQPESEAKAVNGSGDAVEESDAVGEPAVVAPAGLEEKLPSVETAPAST